MEKVLTFLEQYEIWVYVVGGAVGLYYLQKLIFSWHEWRTAVFGLERESAQRRFAASMTAMILIVLFVLAEFIIVSFVSPSLPQMTKLATPTLNILASPTPTLGPGETAPAATPTVMTIALATIESGQCIPGELEWIEPSAGKEISGTVTLKGTVNIPDFGFYKYEFAAPPGTSWNTIAAGDKPVTNDKLGEWNTTAITTGDYLLRLVAVDNKNNALPACTIQVRIVPPSE